MTRQPLPFSVSYWSSSQNASTELRAGEHFCFDLDALNQLDLGDLKPLLVDLLRIASSVYVVDRLVKRHTLGEPKRPSRIIGIRVPVLNESFWNQPEVRSLIGEAVEFISGDFWDIEFVHDSTDYKRSSSMFPCYYSGQSPLINLYSGGLDSAAGMVLRLADDPSRPVIPITAWHHSRQRHMVRRQFSVLRKRLDAKIDPLIVRIKMDWNSGLDRKQQERSQRCRAFLFASLGAIAAIMHEQQSVEMFESGVGAINMPLMAGMVGWKATKSSHPTFLRIMSRLASHVAEKDIEFRLPFFNRTKGEMTQALAVSELKKLALLTGSCIGFPLRDSQSKQCGWCPACIFRRQAMEVAGIQEPDDTYKYDFLSSPLSGNQIPENRLRYLKSFLMQVAQLKNVSERDRLPSAFERHVVSTGIVKHGESQKGVIALMARYADEWLAIAAKARRNGHEWAKLLAPRLPQAQGVSNASV
jgi:7-cyano-7-deazaguanine synthase in queuosine biosynthesis